MYYEKQILPLDHSGNFVLAIHFPRHKIGGECTRESSHAFFGHGNASDPSKLIDITSLCCVERAPNKQHARELNDVSRVQTDIKQPEQAWMYSYQAEQALKTTSQVPRSVLTTRNGLLLVGIDAELEDMDAGLATYVRRIIDIDSGTIKIDDHEIDIRKGNSKIYPKAISSDGKSTISHDPHSTRQPVLAEQDLSSLETVTQFKSIYPVSDFVFLNDHWIANDEEYLYKFPRAKNKAINKFKIPTSVFGWSATTANDSNLIAFSGDKGLVSTIDCDNGKVRKYYPHPGCKRDDFATAKLSDNGRWLVSKIHRHEDLVVTSLENGESWIVAQLQDQTIIERAGGEYRSESSIPAAFNFIGEKLLVSDSTEVREVEFGEPISGHIFMSEQGNKGARIPLKLTTNQSLDNLIEQANLARVADTIRDLHYPACFLKSKVSKKAGWHMPHEKGAFDLGKSRFGGWPDLPQDTSWPVWQSRPMGFVGQVNLSEVSDVQADIRLPKSGVLLFFVGCGTDTFKREPFDQDMYMLDLMADHHNDPTNAVKVVYAQSQAILTRTRFEGDVLPELFSPCAVIIEKGGVPLPHEYTASYDCLSCNDSELDNYNELMDQLVTDDYENQFSGYPAMLQSTPLEWGPENLSNTRDPFFIPKKEDLLRSFNKDATQWGMLLQLTSDDNPDFMWGDAGHLYIYGPRAELEQGNFENCYANFEN